MASGTILGKVAITPGGSYLAGATYTPLTVVTNNGSSYLSTTTVQGVEPGVSAGWQSYWQLIASIGAGIDSITQTSSSGNVNTYTILYGSGQQFSFDVSNGATGRGVQVLGTYASLSALQAAVQNPSQGDMYNIGEAPPYSLYMYDTTNGQNSWIDLGEITGMSPLIVQNAIANSWETNSDSPWAEQGYAYQCVIQIPGCNEDMYPIVTYGGTEAESGNYSASVQSGSGFVTIYAKQSPPSGSITIPTIVLLD